MSARHIHLNPVGDMFVAALLDAVPELHAPVLAAIQEVLSVGAQATLTPGTSGGIGVSRFRVSAPEGKASARYPELLRRIAEARIDTAAKNIAAALLRRLADAEATVHDVPLDDVHFHELADWNTLADLTAAGCILTRLETASLSLDPLPLGARQVKTQHGLLPIPTPAIAILLQSLPVRDDGIGGERVTSTGAAIAAAVWERATRRPGGVLGTTGYGAGTREISGLANVLVAQLIERVTPGRDAVTVLEFDIDDMTGEEVATASGRLRATPWVIDLTTAHRLGKKHASSRHSACSPSLSRRTRLRLPVSNKARPLVCACGARRVSSCRDSRCPSMVCGSNRLCGQGGGVTRKVEANDLVDEETLALRRNRARRVET